jgi:hypothetical protein
MLAAENEEITTLSSIARDDVVVHPEWAATKQTSLRGAKKIATLSPQQAKQSHAWGASSWDRHASLAMTWNPVTLAKCQNNI